jgi:hypothetical protein
MPAKSWVTAMSKKKRTLGLALIATVFIFVLFTLFFWDFVRDTIVVPIYYLTWVGSLILNSISQEVYLVLLVLLSIVIGNNTLQSIRVRPIPQNHRQNRPNDSARYVYWRRLYKHLVVSQFSRDRFVWETRELILALLAYQEGLASFQVEAMIANNMIDVPDAVRNLVMRKEIQVSMPTSRAIERSAQWLRRVLFKVESPIDPQISHQVDEIVGFIEHRLEITHAGN